VGAAGKMVTLQMPVIPERVRVTLDPKTTALMVLDYVEPCNAEPSCKDKMLPASKTKLLDVAGAVLIGRGPLRRKKGHSRERVTQV
jgi:hypothetical protein